jgi:hypothetical protein
MTPDPSPDFPAVPTRIVEPVVSPEAAVPTPAVCVECTLAGNEALAKTTARHQRKPKPEENYADEANSPD